MPEERWGYCEGPCKGLFLLDALKVVILHDPNQKIMDPNRDKHVLLCPNCSGDRTKASMEALKVKK